MMGAPDPLTAPYHFPCLDFFDEYSRAKCRHDPEVDITYCKICTRALFQFYLEVGRNSDAFRDDDVFTAVSPFRHDRAAEQCVALEMGLKCLGVSGSTPPEERGRWENPPRWRSGLACIDSVQGGFTGVTAIAGREGVGKSIIAHGSAVQACIDGWAVFYCNAEMSQDEIEQRWDAIQALEPEADEARQRFYRVNCPPGFTPYDFRQFFEQSVAQATLRGLDCWPERSLIVLDSINTIAKLAGGSYLQQLDRIAMWAMQTRKIGRGRICWLIIGEQNVRGGIKGEQLSYWSDLYIKLDRNKDKPELIDIEVVKARQGPSQPPVPHRLDYPRRRFVLADAWDLETK